MRFAHLAQRLFNTPLAIMPSKAEVIMAVLAERIGLASMQRLDGSIVNLDRPAAAVGEDLIRGGEYKGYEVIEGVAIIDISGTLVQKLGTLRPYSGMTGYDGIRQNFLLAVEDPAVKAIALDIDSPGGEVSGMLDLCDTLHQARGTKPIWSIVDEMACSGAYAIASCADRITVPRTGVTGSVGVIWMHVDWSEALTKDGIKVTLMTYGDRKADGHPGIPLSKEARQSFQSDINTMGDMFVDMVSRNRGMSSKKVRDTQAGTYLGANGVSVGFADAVMAPDAAFRDLIELVA